LRVNVDLQEDFSLHQALSLYLIDTVQKLDRASPDYPFDVLTLCESIVGDPDQILRRQLDKLKTEKLIELKEAGVEYDERMERLAVSNLDDTRLRRRLSTGRRGTRGLPLRLHVYRPLPFSHIGADM
jgi:hypothetical protein